MIIRHLFIFICFLICFGQWGSRLAERFEDENQLQEAQSIGDESVNVEQYESDIGDDKEAIDEETDYGRDSEIDLEYDAGQSEPDTADDNLNSDALEAEAETVILNEDTEEIESDALEIDAIVEESEDSGIKTDIDEPSVQDIVEEVDNLEADSEQGTFEIPDDEDEGVEDVGIDSEVEDDVSDIPDADLEAEVVDAAFVDDIFLQDGENVSEEESFEVLEDELLEMSYEQDLLEDEVLENVDDENLEKVEDFGIIQLKRNFDKVDAEDLADEIAEEYELEPEAEVVDGFEDEDRQTLEEILNQEWEMDEETDPEESEIDMAEFEDWSMGDFERELEKLEAESELIDFEVEQLNAGDYDFPEEIDGSIHLKGTLQLEAEPREDQACNFGPEAAFLRLVANKTDDIKKRAIYKGLAWGLQFSSLKENMLSGILQDMLVQTWEILHDNRDKDLRIVFTSVCQKLGDFTESNLKLLYSDGETTDAWGLLTAVSVFHECNVNLDYFWGFFKSHVTRKDLLIWTESELTYYIEHISFDDLSDYVMDLGHYMMTKNLPTRWQRWIPQMEWESVYRGLAIIFNVNEWEGEDRTNTHFLAAHLLIALSGHDLERVPSNKIVAYTSRYVTDYFREVVQESFSYVGCFKANGNTFSVMEGEELGLKQCHRSCNGFQYFGYLAGRFCFCGTQEEAAQELKQESKRCRFGLGGKHAMDVYERKINDLDVKSDFLLCMKLMGYDSSEMDALEGEILKQQEESGFWKSWELEFLDKEYRRYYAWHPSWAITAALRGFANGFKHVPRFITNIQIVNAKHDL